MQGKDLLLSKTSIGVFMMTIVIIAKHFGWDIGDASGWTETVVGLVSAALALYGRAKAVTRIVSVAGLKITNG